MFKYDSKFMGFLSYIADLALASLLWTVCSLPVITIGTATTALHYVCMKLCKDECGSVWKLFFHAFRVNFRKATRIWLIHLLLILLIGGSFVITLMGYGRDIPFLSLVRLILTCFLWMVFSYVYPLTACFENTVISTFRNAFLMTIDNFSRSILIGILSAIPLLICLVSVEMFLRSAIFWLLLGVGIIAYLQARILRKVFQKYTPKEETLEA